MKTIEIDSDDTMRNAVPTGYPALTLTCATASSSGRVSVQPRTCAAGHQVAHARNQVPT